MRPKQERINNDRRMVRKRCRIMKHIWKVNKPEDIGIPRGRLRKWNLTCGCAMCKKARYKRKGKKLIKVIGD